MSVGDRVDPAPACWFEVHAGDDLWMVVQTVSGIGASWEQPLEIWEGANGYRIIPTKKKWPNLVLKGVIVDKMRFYEWFESVQIGRIGRARKHLSIRLKQGGKDVASWDVIEAFPLKYSGPTLDTSSSALAFETIEITHHGITRQR
jgi:phage tail-like protein